ncbi:permease-like cell division protein FtsX [Xanthomonas massiliensis]|uniref:permease-like cell division protein FtsX n=1 Tax=Xanthomonas massiliensis TaxID=1720302 RepID=UPI000825830E|nr:permease-like cell division protein FtsX [Xanthomonas massiliensis]
MNKPASTSPARVVVWWNHHLHSIALALGRALQRPWSTALTVLVMAIALALPLGMSAALANLRHFTGDVQASRDINVFLKPEVAAAPAQALAVQLRDRADVAGVQLRTPEQGLQELRASAGLDAAIDALGENPLPTLLIVTPAAAADDARLAQALGELPQVDQVQHDALWRRRLDGWLGLGVRLVQVLGVLLVAGAVLVVGNTVRLDIQSRREEIGVLQLLGASDGFIRRPFVYLGAWYGLVAGALALVLVAGAGLALRMPLAALSESYGSRFALQGLDPLQCLAVLAGTTVLGWLGAWLVTGHFLRQSRPTEI